MRNRTKTTGKSFRKIHLCHTNDFGSKNDKIRDWVVYNGGTFSRGLNDAVTHLVCSKKAWKKYYDVGESTQLLNSLPASHLMLHLPREPSTLSTNRLQTVKAARRQGVKIVTLDWLEDSLLSSKNRRPKPEEEYEVGTRLSMLAGPR
jgi:BRCA1 C Terminus (BRCT) domain